MNALFVVSEPITDFSGISKKILAQVSAIRYNGIKVALSYLKVKDNYKFTGRYIDEEILDKYSNISIISKLQRRSKYNNLFRYVKSNNIKLVYIRYTHFANPFFISFLKKLKNNGTIILLEMPTYPYDQEYQNAGFASKVALLVEKLYRKKIKKYVTRIITVSHHNTIFKTPTIQINNGIDVDTINVKKNRKTDNEFHLIGVATISLWHGYDRVIEGLHNYYRDQEPGRKKVFFHIVGDSSGSEAVRYIEMVKKYELGNYVIFYGKKSGKELDILFDNMDIAVGSIGCHRIGLKYIKSLKNREYCARGIPFFYSETDEDFEDKPFTFKVSANDNPVSIEDIINFIRNNRFDPAKIRNYAIENLTWKKHFAELLHEILNLENPRQMEG